MSPRSISSPTLASSDDPLIDRLSKDIDRLLILPSSLSSPTADCTMSSRWAKMTSRSVGEAPDRARLRNAALFADRARRVGTL
jgi:hypothetical protein